MNLFKVEIQKKERRRGNTSVDNLIKNGQMEVNYEKLIIPF